KVLGQNAIMDTYCVLTEADVEFPVEAILNMPVCTDRLGYADNISRWKTRNIKSGLHTFFSIMFDHGSYLSDTRESRPLLGHLLHLRRQSQQRAAAFFEAPMPRLLRSMFGLPGTRLIGVKVSI